MISLASSFAGLDVIEDARAITLDFSACRSPSRARRRFKAGIDGRVKRKPMSYVSGRTLVVHPVLMQQIRQQVAEKAVDMAMDSLGNFFGGMDFSKGGAVGASGDFVFRAQAADMRREADQLLKDAANNLNRQFGYVIIESNFDDPEYD